MSYIRLPSGENHDIEEEVFLKKESSKFVRRPNFVPQAFPWPFVAKLLLACHASLTLFLIASLIHLKRDFNCIPGPQPPWSPVWNSGVIRHVNAMYKPEKVFQSETSDEVEAAWSSWLEEHDHLLILPTSETKDRLPISVDAFLDPGYSVYGLAVYHQMHCLDHIRKTFYGNKFFPNVSQEMVQFHKNHCFDMLRQAILCHGDVAMLHWWNDTYSYVDASGVVQLTDHYRSLTPSQRAEASFAKWDTRVQCRDMSTINAWAKANAMEDDKYAATVGQLKKRTAWKSGKVH